MLWLLAPNFVHKRTCFCFYFFAHIFWKKMKELSIEQKVALPRAIMFAFFVNRDYRLEKEGLVLAFDHMGEFIADTIYVDLFRNFSTNVTDLWELGHGVPEMEICRYVNQDEKEFTLTCGSISKFMVTEHSNFISIRNRQCERCEANLGRRGHYIKDDVGIWMCDSCIDDACRKVEGKWDVSSPFHQGVAGLTKLKNGLLDKICQIECSLINVFV